MRRLFAALCLLIATVPALSVSPAGGAGTFTAGGSVNQVYVTDLTPGAAVQLTTSSGTQIRSGVADAAGAHLFREVPTGAGYRVVSEGSIVEGLSVTDPTDHPDDSWYASQAASQPLSNGYGYLTTRDGTQLSVNVNFPAGGGAGPWPVVVNYSGYSPSQPGLPPPEALLYMAQGYVVVGVNMRGTGCSGGAFEFMETLQSTDGYDVIETLAHQPWSNGDVGMVGISYSGYSQLYVGATQPPHLRAIAPLSPYSDTYSAILYPGGILNDGFAVEWATDRQNGAKPRASGWVRDRIDDEGDVVCERNQDLRLQSKPLLDRIYSTPFAEHEFDYLNTETFVDQIEVPTYLASQWQDEQTGGSAANLMPLFDPDTLVFGSFTNGTHVEPMAPSEMVHAMAFIDIYVGRKVPAISPFVAAVAPSALASIFRTSDAAALAMPPAPFGDEPTWEAAKAAWEAQPRVRIKWENGAKPGQEGLPIGRAETRHSTWPPTGLVAEALYLQPDGELGATRSTLPDTAGRASSSYVYDTSSKRAKTMDQGREEAWGPHPDYHWDPLDEHHSLSFLTEPYAQEVAYAGQASVDLWLRSTAPDTDIEVTLTEVRPDGQEVYVQSGWLRASHRALDPTRSTELVPFHTHQAADAAPLPAGSFTPVRIEVFPFAHVIRAGSRLRLNVEVPGGNQPFWAFDALPGTPTNEIGHSLGMPSRVVLPRVPAAQSPDLPASLPACTLAGVNTQAVSLRNQPCRPYVPARVATDVAAVPLSDERSSVTVSWTPPPGQDPTGYRVQIVPAWGDVPEPVEVPGGVPQVEIPVDPHVPHEFVVVAQYGDGDGPASSASLPVIVGRTPPSRPPVVPPTEEPPVPAEPSVPAGPAAADAHERFIRLLFRDFLGRSPDVAGERWWVALMEAGATHSAVAARFRDVPEVDARVVRTLYDTYLDRPPTADELVLWAGFIGAGGSIDHVAGQLLGSPERWADAGGNVERFVTGLYAAVLGRAPTGDEAVAAADQVADHGATVAALNLLATPEAVGRRVDQLYAALLHRTPDAAGRAYWVDRIVTGGHLVDLLLSIAATPEYAAQTPRTSGPDVLATAFG